MAVNSSEIDSVFARQWWRALIGNVVGLIRDAHLLLEHGSPGRAQALGVLAAEELGKAWMLYGEAEDSWAGCAPTVIIAADFEEQARKHPAKLASAAAYGQGGSMMWSVWFPVSDQLATDAELAERARAYNLKKQAGFYVDRQGSAISAPASINPTDVGEFLADVAKAASMLLVEDHVRMQNSGEEPDWMDTVWEPLLRYDRGNFQKPAAILRKEQKPAD